MHLCLHATELIGKACTYPIPCCLKGDQTSSSKEEPTKERGDVRKSPPWAF